MRFRQLLPDAGSVDIAELLAGLGLAQRAVPARPYTVANFVASVDGRAAFQGRSGPLGDDGDRALFLALRAEVDAVLIGTGTLRVERYGRLLKDPAVRERRRLRGLPPEPIACILTRSGDLPLDIPLFADPEATIVVFSGAEIDVRGTAANVEVVRLEPGELTFTTALRQLRTDHHIGALLCEGGPMVLGALLGERLVDQLFLTVAPKLTAGQNPPIITASEFPHPVDLALEGALERGGSLFLRYAIRN